LERDPWPPRQLRAANDPQYRPLHAGTFPQNALDKPPYGFLIIDDEDGERIG
jgi:hypothetical protein